MSNKHWLVRAAVTTEYYLGQMTDRTIACIYNGATAGLCGRANLARRACVCDDDAAAAAPLRLPLRRAKRRLKVCVCANGCEPSGSVQAPQTLYSSLLYSTLDAFQGSTGSINGGLVLRLAGTHTHMNRTHSGDKWRCSCDGACTE